MNRIIYNMRCAIKIRGIGLRGDIRMKNFFSCTEAEEECLKTKRFAISHQLSGEQTKKIHIHDYHEIYYSISGGKQFFINSSNFSIQPGDVFFLAKNRNHHLVEVDKMCHERINIAIHPVFLRYLSNPRYCPNYDLEKCFKNHEKYLPYMHLEPEQQTRFRYLCKKMTTINGSGSWILENAVFCEIMVLLNNEFQRQHNLPIRNLEAVRSVELTNNILQYLNDNITKNISLVELSQRFYVTESYLCRKFKSDTGKTIKEYVAARRISLAKTMFDLGKNANTICESLGFSNYNTFYKTFIRIVGVSPTDYSRMD